MIPANIIDEIFQTARIEEVIGEFVLLKRAGSNLKGLSPFTDEKTPSFVVSPAKQIYKCFSTGKGGNAVSFLMEKEHYTYPEALKWLADKYNIKIPESKQPTPEELAAFTERDSLFIINEFAKEHFMNTLHESEEGKNIGLSYFEERGFYPEIIKKFQLGYCMNTGDDFTKAALNKSFKLEYLEKVGLTKSKDERHFDFFRGRVMFPIHSESGRVLGFGGRTLFTDKKVAKYFNSPESIVYNKSRILYGLYFAKSDIIKYDNCLLCEGYTDVISMHQAGIQNAVSSSGTSLTKEQIRLINRYTKNITILYDGDAAGIKASFRGIDLILEEGLNVKVVLFPDGEDPDSYSKKVSSTELEEYIKNNTQDFISFKANILLKDSENDPIKKAELIKDIVHSVSIIPNDITRAVYQKQIAQLFEIQENVVENEVFKTRKTQLVKDLQEEGRVEISLPKEEEIQTANWAKQSYETQLAIAEYNLIRLMVLYAGILFHENQAKEDELIEITVLERIISELQEDELTFTNPIYQEIYSIYTKSLKEDKTILNEKYFVQHSNQEIVKVITDIFSNEVSLSQSWASKFNVHISHEKDNLSITITHVIYLFKLAKVMEEIQNINKQLLDESIPDEDKLILLSKFSTMNKIKAKISEKLGIAMIT